MVTLLLFLLCPLSTSADVLGNTPFCLTADTTWLTDTCAVTNVLSAEACQQLCGNSSDCHSITWYDSQAVPYPHYCMLYPTTSPDLEVPCTNCYSGPSSCTCSGDFTCSLGTDSLIELVIQVEEELVCAELCSTTAECQYYSWYSGDSVTLQLACALLR